MSESGKKQDKDQNKTPSPYDSKICWQCQYIIAPELGMDMMPESGGYCVCKGWTDNVFGEACELFIRKYGSRQQWVIDPITKEDWDKLNNM